MSRTKLYLPLGLQTLPSPTVPQDIKRSSARTGFISIEETSLTIYELTVPLNSREILQAARMRETNTQPYLYLISDSENKGLLSTSETEPVRIDLNLCASVNGLYE